MAETEARDGSKKVIKVVEEIEGEQIGTKNYRFSKIGESVPIQSDAGFKFDMDSLPSCPLVVSELFGVIFVAHSSGFCVVRTKDVMDTAEELKNGGNGSSIQELSVVDVSLGKVSLLALSASSSMLAASVGFNLYFFSVSGLLNKDHEPSFSKSLNGSSCIKDVQWSRHLEDQYVVLTTDGNLYSGAGQDEINNFMDNVDAVNWSMNGKFLAVAKDDYLSILSSKFEEKLRIMLSFDSLVDDSNADCVVKVDSVRWVRPDCIVLGCFRLSADGKEENYLVQHIIVKDGKITKPSSNPVALSFSDAFLAINDDDIPFGSGPYMLMSYLDECELAFAANRKNMDQHIVLFGWSSDKKNEAKMIEISNDAWLPTINLQDNSDDNLILGLAVSKVYGLDEIRLVLGEEDTEVSPCCVLLCLTVDGKLFMFHFASATGPSVLPEAVNSVSDEEEESALLSSQHRLLNICNDEKQIEDQGLHELHPQEVKVNEPSEKAGYETHMRSGDGQVKSTAFTQLFNCSTQQDVPVVRVNNSRDEGKSLFPQKQGGNLEAALFKTSQPVSSEAMVKDLKRFENQELGGVNSSAGFVSKSANDKSNRTLLGASLEDFRASTDLPGNKASISLLGSSGSFSSGSVFSLNGFGAQSSFSPHAGVQESAELSGKSGTTSLHVSSGSFSGGGIFSSRTSDVKPSFLPHAASQGNRPDTRAGTTDLSSGLNKFSFTKTTSAPSTSSNLLGQGASTGARVTNSLPIVSNAQPSLGTDKRNQRSHPPSRLLNSGPNLSEQYSVEEMAKELDALLDSIEGTSGFYDASVALRKPSVTALEEGIWALSDRCRKWSDTMDQGIGEFLLLLDRTVQVLGRKTHIEAIVKQATDSHYWDIWNCQKLSPELEMKRRHILEINQNLTNQLIELQRHLNTLEFQKFGDKGDVQMSRRSFHTKHGPPRYIQSIHSLHNTMNAQLGAAEKLSECLSKQMAVLSIETEPVKKQNVKKELFDTIGISYNDTNFSSPGQEKAREIPSKNEVLISSCSAAAKAHLKKNQPSAHKSSEPETARRRRDSLDKSWASIEPPKTTVKRMLLQEDHQMSPGWLSLPTGTRNLNQQLSEGSVVSCDIPRGALNLSQSRGSQDAQIKRHSQGQSNSSPWENSHSDSLKTPGTAVISLGSGSQSLVSRDAARDSRDPTAERSRNRLTFTLKSDTMAVNDPKFSSQSQSFVEPLSNTATSLATNIFQKKPIELLESSTKDTVRSKFAVGDGNQRSIATESSSFWSRKSQESPFSAVLTASSAAFSGKSYSLETSTRESQAGEVVSSSSIASLPIVVASSSSPSFVFKDGTSTSTSALSFARPLIGSGIKLDATQTVLSGSSASFPSFPSTTSFGDPKEQMTPFSITPSVNIELNPSKLELSKLNPNASESSTPQVVSVPKFDLKTDETSSAQTSPPQPKLSSGTSSLKLGLSVPPKPTSELPTSIVSERQLNLSGTNSPALATNSKPEQPLVAPALSSPVISIPVDGVGENYNSDVTITQEDEMEEEAPDTSQLTLGNLGGFGLGSAPNPSAPKQNPFGASYGNAAANTSIASFTAAPSTGDLFRPASFNIESTQPNQLSQQTNFGAFSGGFGSNNNQSNAGQGFGQPARIGSGQQALGSVLGSFGQSRQFGAGLPGSVASPSPFGSGFGGSQSVGGFATASSGGGFANLASGGGGFGALATGGGGFAAAATGGGGGFGALATGGGGGFAAAATGGGGGFGALATGGGGGGFAAAATGGGGGFAAAATGGGGFAAAPAAGGGFAGAASGGAFSSQGGSAFSNFGSPGGTGRPSSELFTQMRR